MDETCTQLFQELNLDKHTADEVCKSFTKVKERYIIEGEKVKWLACAVYVMANQAVSLNQLLRHAKLSLVDFLSMLDKWLKMTEQGNEIRSKVAHLERNFNVSAVVFKKYKEIFPDVFKPISASKLSSVTTTTTSQEQQQQQSTQPTQDTKQPPNRTRKSAANARLNYEVTSTDIYSFCWRLYINIKASQKTISEDLVSSYHLLLACIDYCYANALVSKCAHNVLNPNFKGLPEDFEKLDHTKIDPTKQNMCILQVLCNNWDGIVVDAKGIRDYSLKPHIESLVSRKVLLANPVQVTNNQSTTMYLGLFDSSNFDSNRSKLEKEHADKILDTGDFDEHLFLTEEELGLQQAYDTTHLKKMINEKDPSGTTPPSGSQANIKLSPVSTTTATTTTGTNTNGSTESLPIDLDKQKPSLENGGRFVPQTPLSNRNYMANKAVQPSSPVANATRKVGDLYRMLAECTGEPTSSLEDIFKLCTVNPRDTIMEKTSQMCERFVSAYTTDQDDEPQAVELAKKRVDLARKLYFKVLEAIIVREQKRLPTDKIGDSLSGLLSHEIFHISLFACCVEIVLASHNAKRTFPWVLDVYKDIGETRLYPFLFYKVIELVIREEERLSRDIVKHLATIEEKVLDSMAWQSDSPLWTAIAANGSIPSCQDVVLPPTTNKQNPFEMSPLSSLRRHEGFQSPMPVSGRYSITPLEGGARRRLFDGGLSGDVSSSTTSSTTNNTNANSTQQQYLHVVMPHKSENGDIKYVIVNTGIDSDHHNQRHQQELDHSPAPIRPAVKANPVNLFFRKVYYLAQLRFRDLWNRLSVNSIDLQRKIWTLFEDQIRNHTNLLRDRHLDQMIMCATYAVIKVCETERSSHFFQEIMKAYRNQPQANIEVYRNVLLAKPALKFFETRSTRPATSSSVVTRSPSKRTAVTSPLRNGCATSAGNSSGTNVSSSSSSAPASSGVGVQSQASSSSLPERGDLIQFYNQVYVPQVREIMVKFATEPDSSLSLSPLPRMNTNPISPWRRVSQQHSVFVSPLKSNSLPASPGRQLSYNFHRSPAKDLQTINNMINRQRAACKRILQDDDGENTKRQRISDVASRRLNDIMNDRRTTN